MLRLTSAIALLLTLLISAVHAQNRDWVLLGQQSVGFRVDRDVINVGQSEDWFRNRSFRALHFMAERNAVHMMSVKLVYLNGYTEEFRIDRLIPQGGQLPIDLRGERSYLKQIEMVYRSRPDFRGEALVKVFGEPVRRVGGGPGGPPGRGDWEELGCQQVNLFGRDRNSIRVGRREGRFKAIRLHVRGADVEMLDLKVIYANGQARRYLGQEFDPGRRAHAAAGSARPRTRHRPDRHGLSHRDQPRRNYRSARNSHGDGVRRGIAVSEGRRLDPLTGRTSGCIPLEAAAFPGRLCLVFPSLEAWQQGRK